MNAQNLSANFQTVAQAAAPVVQEASRKRRALGKKHENSVSPEAKAASRLALWAAKRKAAELVREVDEGAGVRLSKCGYCSYRSNVTLNSVTHADGTVSGQFGGVISCGNVWNCPVCSRRISGQRADELNTLLAWARAEGFAVVMLTQTFRHDRSMPCAASVDGVKKANTRLRNSKGWRKLAHVGNVMATEVTHGQANGWHPHLHSLMVLRCSPDEAQSKVEALRAEWLRALQYQGFTGNERAWHVQPATAAGEYVAKFGAAEELVLGETKAGRNGSRSPWQLLADARDGDALAARLFQEYAQAFKGKRQLVWSRGLKGLAGIDEAREAQAEAEEKPEPVMVREWLGASDDWRAARRRRCALVAAVEAGTDLDVAESGPTDAETWRAELDGAQVLEPEQPQSAAPDNGKESEMRISKGAKARAEKEAKRRAESAKRGGVPPSCDCCGAEMVLLTPEQAEMQANGYTLTPSGSWVSPLEWEWSDDRPEKPEAGAIGERKSHD